MRELDQRIRYEDITDRYSESSATALARSETETKPRDDYAIRNNNHIKQSLIEDGITIDKKYWTFAEIYERDVYNPDQYMTEFQNAYVYDRRAREGVIIAHNNRRRSRNALSWSEAVFLQYKQFHPGKVRNLKYIYQSNITNDLTVHCIEVAVASSEGEEVEVGGVAWMIFRPGSNSFYALLGSPSGRGAGHMLNDHFDEVEKKEIWEIHVTSRDRYTKTMKLVIGPVWN